MCKKYEAIFIIKYENDNKTKEIINKLNEIITSENCEIYYKEEKGICNLAYEIKGEKKGAYYYINFKNLYNRVPALAKISTKVNTIEEILKHIII